MSQSLVCCFPFLGVCPLRISLKQLKMRRFEAPFLHQMSEKTANLFMPHNDAWKHTSNDAQGQNKHTRGKQQHFFLRLTGAYDSGSHFRILKELRWCANNKTVFSYGINLLTWVHRRQCCGANMHANVLLLEDCLSSEFFSRPRLHALLNRNDKDFRWPGFSM